MQILYLIWDVIIIMVKESKKTQRKLSNGGLKQQNEDMHKLNSMSVSVIIMVKES